MKATRLYSFGFRYTGIVAHEAGQRPLRLRKLSFHPFYSNLETNDCGAQKNSRCARL